jgi:hypothetical protein
MKLTQHKNVDEVIGVQKQHKFKITDGSQAIIMDSLINLYSDPIGSIVREITSNCIDANRERVLKLDSKIPMETGDDTSYWSDKQTVCIEYVEKNTILGIDECIMFHDYGCGLSQERVQNVFTTFGASTKRDNNYEIGGFGLGAKSPLAYADTFYVSSRHNGTETYYMIYRNNDNVPHMDQVYQKATDEKNGSSVIVPIKDGYYDRRKFKEAINEQLCFFKNLVYKNVEEALGEIKNYYTLQNRGKVIEDTEDYVLTNDGRDLFLLVGDVVYPINWDLLDDNESSYKASVGVRFNIGVLDLVPSREELRYTPTTVSAIKAKLATLKAKFKADAAADYTMTDYVEYLIGISNLSNSGSSRYYSLQSDCPKAIKASMANVGAYDIPFTGNANLTPAKFHSGNTAFHQLFDGVSVFYSKRINNNSAIGGETIYHKELNTWDEFFTHVKNHKHLYYVEGNFSTPKSYTIIDKEESFMSFKVDATKRGARINDKTNFVDPRADYLKVSTFNTVSALLKKSSFVKSYADVEEKELSESYGDVLDSKTRRKINKQVFARNAEIKSDSYNTEIRYTNQEYRISDLQDLLLSHGGMAPNLKAVVYAETKNVDELNKVVKIISHNKEETTEAYRYGAQKFENHYRVVKVSKDVAKQFKDIEGFITAEEFMKSPTHLQSFMTAQKIKEYKKSFEFLGSFGHRDSNISNHLCELYEDLKNYDYNYGVNSPYWKCDDIALIVKEILQLDIADEVRYDMKIIDKLEEVVEYSQGLDLLNYVHFTNQSRKSVIDLLSLKDKTPDFEQVKQLTLTA